MTDNTTETMLAVRSQKDGFIQSLKALMLKHNNMSEAELARQTELPQPTIHRLLSGQTEDPRVSTLSTIADYFNVTLDQLLGKAPFDNLITPDHLQHVKTIPIISWTEVLQAVSFIPTLNSSNWSAWVTVDIKATPCSYALYTRSCMMPRFPLGSLLIVGTESKPRDGDLVIVHFKGTEAATVRLLHLDGLQKELRGFSADTPVQVLTSDVKILGVMNQLRYSYKH